MLLNYIITIFPHLATVLTHMQQTTPRAFGTSTAILTSDKYSSGHLFRCACTEQAVGGRPPRYAPAPLLPQWAPKRFAPPSRRQRSSSFLRPTRSHAHRCSRLTRQHGSEQTGLVTLTFGTFFGNWHRGSPRTRDSNTTFKVKRSKPFDLESSVRVMWTWATSVPILVFLGLSVLDLGPIYATDRRLTDRCQKKALLNAPPSY